MVGRGFYQLLEGRDMGRQLGRHDAFRFPVASPSPHVPLCPPNPPPTSHSLRESAMCPDGDKDKFEDITL